MASRGTVGTNIFIFEDIQGLAKCGGWLYAFEAGSKTAKRNGAGQELDCQGLGLKV